MTDTTTIEPKPKPKRRKQERLVDLQSKEFAGLTPNDCPAQCNETCCVITGKAYCGHPYKGGLRYSDMNNKAAIEQMQKAKVILAHKAVDKRFK